MVHKFKNKVENFLFSEMPVDSMDYERLDFKFCDERIISLEIFEFNKFVKIKQRRKRLTPTPTF